MLSSSGNQRYDASASLMRANIKVTPTSCSNDYFVPDLGPRKEIGGVKGNAGFLIRPQITWLICIGLNLPPLALAALVSWIKQPGQPVTTIDAPVLSMF